MAATVGDLIPLVLEFIAGGTAVGGLAAAEAALVDAIGRDGGCHSLSLIASDTDADGAALGLDPSVRQLALLLLKEPGVAKHWEPEPPNKETGERNFVASAEEKAAVRDALPALLSDDSGMVRKAAGMAIAAIGGRDYPEEWPELLPALLGCLTPEAGGGDLRLVHGSIRCLSFFAENLPTQHVAAAMSKMLPELMRVAGDAESYPTRLRARAAGAARHLFTPLGSVIAVRGAASDEARAVLMSLLPDLVSLLNGILVAPATAEAAALDASDAGLLHSALRVYVGLLKEFPEEVEAHLEAVAGTIVSFSEWLRPLYEAGIVAENLAEADYDSDGEMMGMAPLSMETLASLSQLAGTPRKAYRRGFKEVMPSVVETTLGFMQLTAAQLESWADDPYEFVADEDDDSLNSSVRHCGEELLAELVETQESSVVQAVVAAAAPRLAAAVERLVAGEDLPDAVWRPTEAALLALGAVAPVIVDQVSSARGAAAAGKATKKKGVDIPALLGALQGLCGAREDVPVPNAFIAGRALWLAARLAQVVPVEQCLPFTGAASAGLAADQPIPVRVAACRALQQYCKRLPAETVRPLLPQAISHTAALISAADGTADATEATMALAIGTMRALLRADTLVAGAVAPALALPLTSLWTQLITHRLLGDGVRDCLATMAASPDGLPHVASQLLPHLTAVMSNTADHEPGVVEQVLEVARSLVDHSGRAVDADGDDSGVIPDSVFSLLVPIVTLVCTTDDGSAMRSGADTLASFVHVATRQVLELTLPDGTSGIQAIVSAAEVLLNPETVSDDAAEYAGKLVLALATKCGDALPADVLPAMLQAAGARLAVSRLSGIIQALTCVFAALVHSHGAEAVVDVLSTAELLGPVCSQWAANLPEFEGAFDRKLCYISLISLLRCPAALAAVGELVVDGDEVEVAEPAGGRRYGTRSATASGAVRKEFQQLPWAVKAAQSLVRVLVDEVARPAEDDSGDELDDEEYGGGGDFGAGHLGFGGGGGDPFAPAEDYMHLLSDAVDGPSPFHDHSGWDSDDADFDEDGYVCGKTSHPLFGVDGVAALREFFVWLGSNDAGLAGALLESLPPHEREYAEAALRGETEAFAGGAGGGLA